MSETNYSWRTLPNPFANTDNNGAPKSRITGRSTDILNIIMGSQNALILTGAPRIGKTTLIRYLQAQPSEEWSWRKEERVATVQSQIPLQQIFFVQPDLSALEDTQSLPQLLQIFTKACINTLSCMQSAQTHSQEDCTSLRTLLRSITHHHPEARYILMFDAIERLARSELSSELKQSDAQTPLERGIALLNRCGAIRMLVDLLDEFSQFGVILSLTSLPRAKNVDQFTHISADLAHFATMTLQCFTRNDTEAFLAQSPSSFDSAWTDAFHALGGDSIFNAEEQRWILDQAGTHPYLLQQFCFQAFYFKCVHADLYGKWMPLQEKEKRQLLEVVNTLITTFLTSLAKRLQEALEKAGMETKQTFYQFISSLNTHISGEQIYADTWDWLGSELRYILASEGIIRYDPFQSIYPPGAMLRRYLIQRTEEYAHTTPQRGWWLSIIRPGYTPERTSLSELEYRLLKTLLQNFPQQCTEEELMKHTWGHIIGRATFTQRMHHLRKKLRERSDGTDLIVNHYGGQYSLRNSDWLRLD